MIPRIIHQIWLGGTIPPDIFDLMQTAWKVNPEYEYKLWHEERFKVEGIDIHQFDAQNENVAGLSGGLRLVILKKYGGIYLDCDVECLKPFDWFLDLGAFAAEQGDGNIGNAVFGAEPDHPWIQWQLDHARECIGDDAAWSTRLMTRAPRSGVAILPSAVFYPWLWSTPKESRILTEATYATHHWRGSWQK